MASPEYSPAAAVKPVRLVLGLAACVGIVILLMTLLFGFQSIPANSVGVKTRFGAYEEEIQPGLTYAIPYIDEIMVVPTQRLLKLEFGFGTSNATNAYQVDRDGEDTETMVTGDLNTALVPWVVQYPHHRSEAVSFRRARAGTNSPGSLRERHARGHR